MADEITNILMAKVGEGSLELTEELIRLRAYHFYENRGREDGHDVEDWLRAEAEIMGKKPAARSDTRAAQASAPQSAA